MASHMQKIGSLCASIEGEIKSVSTDNFAEIEGDIEALRQEARAKEGPEPGAEYASLLFRRFADEANYLKQNAPLAGGRKKGDVNRDEELGFGPAMSRLVDMIPEIVYKGTGQQLAGKEAFKYNIFWLRCWAILFSFLCFVVMSTVDFINSSAYTPGKLFNSGCLFYADGSFELGAFKFIIAVASMLFAHSTLFVIYYLLPMNNMGRKYIPGLQDALASQKMLDPDTVNAQLETGSTFCARNGKLVEVIVDAFLALLTFIALLTAVSAITEPAPFHVIASSSGSQIITGDTPTYFTMDTFQETFSETEPQCLASNSSATPKIRAAIAMLFFALFGLILTVQVSLWSYQAQKLERAGGGYEPTGEGDSGAMISATARGGVSTRNDDDQEEISF